MLQKPLGIDLLLNSPQLSHIGQVEAFGLLVEDQLEDVLLHDVLWDAQVLGFELFESRGREEGIHRDLDHVLHHVLEDALELQAFAFREPWVGVDFDQPCSEVLVDHVVQAVELVDI